MSFFPHVVIGAAVGSYSPNIPVAILGGVISHFVLDFIPHYDPVIYGVIPKGSLKRVILSSLLILDIVLSLVVLALTFKYPTIFWGAVAGALVDIDNFLQYFFKDHFPIAFKYLKIDAHQRGSRWHQMTNIYFGLFNQSWVTFIGLLILYYKLYH